MMSCIIDPHLRLCCIFGFLENIVLKFCEKKQEVCMEIVTVNFEENA